MCSIQKKNMKKKKKDFDFGSYKKLYEFENLFNKFVDNFPNKYADIINSFIQLVIK